MPAGWILAFTVAAALTPDAVAPLQVRVNGVDQGIRVLRQTAAGTCVSRADLRELGVPDAALPAPPQTPAPCLSIERLAEASADELRLPFCDAAAACVPLAHLGPHLRAELQASAARLDISVDPVLLDHQRRSLDRRPEPLVPRYSRSAYFNYGLDYSDPGGGAPAELRAPLELAARWDRWLLDSTFLAQRGDTRRLFTTLSLDVPERLATLRLGDVATGGGRSAGGTSLLGVQWARNFGYEPLVRRSPSFDFDGVLDTPATVEVYLDDRRVFRGELPAGPFSLEDVPALSGQAGTARIEIVDAFGSRRVIEQPFYLGSALLAAGESEFGYSVGLPRLAAADPAYADAPAASFAHRRGLTDALTLGIEGEGSRRHGLLGLAADLGLGDFGELSVNVAASDSPGASSAWSGFAVYRYSARRWQWTLDATAREADFTTLASSATGVPSWRWRGRLGMPIAGGFNSFLSLSRGREHDEVVERYGVGLSGRVGRVGSLSLQWQWRGDRSRPESLLSFSSSLPGRQLAQISANADGEGQRAYAARLGTTPTGLTGQGYRFEFTRTTLERSAALDSATAEYELRAQRFTARASHRQGDSGSASRVLVAGTVGVTGGRPVLGPPVRGSFAAVAVEGVAGAEVFADRRRIGRVDGLGPLLVPDLSPYQAHTVSVEVPASAPVSVQLRRRSERFALAHRSGELLRFKAWRQRMYEGHVQDAAGGGAIEFASVSVARAGTTVAQTVTGEGGYLYLENLDPGTYEFEVAAKPGCRFQAELPDNESLIAGIGTQICRAPDSETAQQAHRLPR